MVKATRPSPGLKKSRPSKSETVASTTTLSLKVNLCPLDSSQACRPGRVMVQMME